MEENFPYPVKDKGKGKGKQDTEKEMGDGANEEVQALSQAVDAEGRNAAENSDVAVLPARRKSRTSCWA